ncbi:hypothetical protein [Rhizobium tropici]|uniref:Uncharacterized protein n=1 Tax=Rhizobium tropici TaxID=398 RepID=A0ABR6R659_RHITR|nr:hypothetical protein [Rhizobium tropici]MBB4244331.1 hypothetical protein [Rhizobium tropici]MBB6494670.1 hypothetical protein [Rhizobium tropici]
MSGLRLSLQSSLPRAVSSPSCFSRSFASAALARPALLPLMTKRVRADAQGRLQGMLTCLMSLASMIAPWVISETYFASRHIFPGWSGFSVLRSIFSVCRFCSQTGLRQIDRGKERGITKESRTERHPSR